MSLSFLFMPVTVLFFSFMDACHLFFFFFFFLSFLFTLVVFFPFPSRDAGFHILITSYQLLVSDEKYFRRVKWQYMVLDEAQAIKSSTRFVPITLHLALADLLFVGWSWCAYVYLFSPPVSVIGKLYLWLFILIHTSL